MTSGYGLAIEATRTTRMPMTAPVWLDLPADFQYLAVLEGCIGALLNQEIGLADREARTFEVILAVHETCSNIVEHAYGDAPGRIEISFAFDDNPRRFVIDLHDMGQPFVLPELQQPNEHEPQTRGYGLFLIHRLMDEVRHEPAAGNNHWRLVKYLK